MCIDVQRYNVHDVRPLLSAYASNPSSNLFAHEEELARNAKRYVKGGGGEERRGAATAAGSAGEKDKATSGSSWMSQLVSWLPISFKGPSTARAIIPNAPVGSSKSIGQDED